MTRDMRQNTFIARSHWNSGLNLRKILSETLLGVSFFMLTVVSAWISIKTRSVGEFAVFWLPNALLLGLWIRFPRWMSASSVVGAALAYLAADFFVRTGSIVTFIFACGNLASVGVAYTLLTRLSIRDRQLRGLTSVLKMFSIVLAASAVGGLAGLTASHLYLRFTMAEGWSYWFVTDVVNYVTILPALLSLPRSKERFRRFYLFTIRDLKNLQYDRLLPFGALTVVSVAAFLVGGPGAITFPLPALLWCALTYDFFTVACLTLAFGVWSQWGIATGVFLPRPQELTQGYLQLSLHMGIAFIAVCPNILVAVVSSHKKLVAKLQLLAWNDPLSGLLNRRSFFERGESLRAVSAETRQPLSLLMIDIDNFKSINDSHGHLAGDEVIRRIAKTIGDHTMKTGILARIGGEEFAILVSGLGFYELAEHAERIRTASSDIDISLNERRFGVTVSIGAIFNTNIEIGIDRMMQRADEALYQAKQSGRNKVVLFDLNGCEPA